MVVNRLIFCWDSYAPREVALVLVGKTITSAMLSWHVVANRNTPCNFIPATFSTGNHTSVLEGAVVDPGHIAAEDVSLFNAPRIPNATEPATLTWGKQTSRAEAPLVVAHSQIGQFEDKKSRRQNNPPAAYSV
jgi:hypothetical protein